MVSIDAFKQGFKGEIVEPGSIDYPAAIARWATNSEQKARYVAFPKTEADVSLALNFATSNAVPLAIKCGGHNPSGASSITDGLCIDLSRHFNTARVDPGQRLVCVGGGAVWETVDRATIAHGLATPAGTVNHTGVGGLTLAGGYGWLSGQHGLVIDNLVQATVVIANGSVVTASSTSHPDLFWAIRGGGSNFGIVTEFVFKVHPQRKTVFAGHIIFPPSLLGKLSEAVDEWWSGAKENEGLMVVLTREQLQRHPVAILVVFYNGSEEEGRANFKRFYDLGPVADLAREIPYEQLNGILNQHSGHGRKTYMSGTSLRSRLLPHIHETFNCIVSSSAAHPWKPTLPPLDVMMAYELFPLNKVCSVPSSATSFRSRGPQANIVLLVSWDKEETEGDTLPHARAISQELIKIVEAAEERTPTNNENCVYGNYVCDTSLMPSRAEKLWGDHYPRLQRIKKEYDPKVAFDRWFPIHPAA